MAPALVFDRTSGELVGTVGSPGGSQIIGYVTKTLVGVLDWNLDVRGPISLPNSARATGPPSWSVEGSPSPQSRR